MDEESKDFARWTVLDVLFIIIMAMAVMWLIGRFVRF